MLIVISSPEAVGNEAETINQLFEDGLTILHLRKPGSRALEVKLLLEKISIVHRSKIALHQHHHLAQEFGIKRLHFTEAERKKQTDKELQDLSVAHILSTSVHTMSDYKRLKNYFKYCFLSPVFDSISKPGLTAGSFDGISTQKKDYIQLIALGGVDENNCGKALEMGFDGVAVLGAIWNRKNKTEIIKKIKEKWVTNVQSY